MAIVHSAKGNLHRHLQGYAGQILSYEMIKDLMSFVFDMVKDPSISWVSQDSHIRLLNGIFKKVGQTLDDKCIAAIEGSVLTAFAFPNPTEGKPAGLKPAEAPVPVRPADSTAALVPPIKGSASGSADIDSIYRRLHLDMAALEIKFAKIADAASQESHEASKRAALERVELESRLAMEREERANTHSNERAEYLSCLDMQQAELQEMMNRFLKSQEERSRQADHTFDARMKTLGSMMDSMKEKIEVLFQEHEEKQSTAMNKTDSLQDTRIKSMERKLLEMEEKAAYSRKAIRRISFAAVTGIIITVIGFAAVIYFLNVL
jgi:hypothetical protein